MPKDLADMSYTVPFACNDDMFHMTAINKRNAELIIQNCLY